MADKLLQATAKAFEEMRYVDDNFIRENNVSANDCHAWCSQVAAILNGYLSAPKEVQNLILASGVMLTPAMQRIIWQQGLSDMKMRELLTKLGGVS